MDYYNIKAVSNTSLGYINPDQRDGTPEQFLAFLDGKIDIKSSAMELGTYVHAAILEPERFEYTDVGFLSAGVKKVLTELRERFPGALNLAMIPAQDQIQCAEDMSWGKSYSNNDKLDKLAKGATFFKNANKKDTILCPTSYRDKVEAMKNSAIEVFPELVDAIDPETGDRIGAIDPETGEIIEAVNEQEVFWEEKFESGNIVPCKSKLDRMFINMNERTVRMWDVKTSGSIAEFNRSVEKYHYYRQQEFYKRAVRQWLIQQFGKKVAAEFRIIEFAFIVILSSYPFVTQKINLDPLYERAGKQELRKLMPLVNATLNHGLRSPKSIIHSPSKWLLRSLGVANAE